MTYRPSRRSILLTAATLIGTTAPLAGCGVGSRNSAEQAAAASTPSGVSGPHPSAGASWSLPDPRSLTGQSDVADLGDITPITTAPHPALPTHLTDTDGNAVSVTTTSRILALDLYGTLSRVVEGLGLGSSIVGHSISSTEKALAATPVVTTDGHVLNAEAILSLSPTVVLIDHSIGPTEAITQIRHASVPTFVLKPTRTLDSVESDIEAIGQVLGLDADAKALGQRARSEVEDAQATMTPWIPANPLRIAFLYVRGTGGIFFILGKGTGADVLISGIGGRDIATEEGITDIKPATAEALASLDPELIICMTEGLRSTGGLDGLLSRPGIAQTTAGQRRRVVTIPDGQSLAFGPQSGALLRATAMAVYQPTQATAKTP